jgi:hypothetical protein
LTDGSLLPLILRLLGRVLGSDHLFTLTGFGDQALDPRRPWRLPARRFP